GHASAPLEVPSTLAAGSARAELPFQGYPTNTRAFRNTRSHGESSPHSAGAQLKLAVRSVRSGCGIRMVARPSVVVTPATASVEPFGFAGYWIARVPSPSM